MKIRIKFKKTGNMRFIGHLDVMRYFQKAIRRAGVDIRYSEGFSPHQIMSFAAPLGVGLTSEAEYVDIEVHSSGSSAEMISRLNAAMAEGFEVLSYRLLPDSAKNAMSIVAAADYRVTFRAGYGPEDGNAADFFRCVAYFYERQSVPVVKKTKKGETQMDLKPLVYEIRPDMRVADALFMKVCAGSAANVKSDLVLDAYFADRGIIRPPFAFCTHRLEVYADLAGEADKKAGRHRFVSLEALGEELTDGQARDYQA